MLTCVIRPVIVSKSKLISKERQSEDGLFEAIRLAKALPNVIVKIKSIIRLRKPNSSIFSYEVYMKYSNLGINPVKTTEILRNSEKNRRNFDENLQNLPSLSKINKNLPNFAKMVQKS